MRSIRPGPGPGACLRDARPPAGAKQAQVALLEPSKGTINVKGTETCSVVFAVAESDPEYGDVGPVITCFGWASQRELARGDGARLTEIQRDANEGVDANLFPDGTLVPGQAARARCAGHPNRGTPPLRPASVTSARPKAAMQSVIVLDRWRRAHPPVIG